MALGTITDLGNSQADLIAENVLLEQLVILRHQVIKSTFSKTDHLWIVSRVSRVKNWKEASLIFKPDSLPSTE